MGVLIDTCVWIAVERARLHPDRVSELTGDDSVYLSPVTIAELKFGAEAAADPGIRQRRLAALRRLERKPLLPIAAGTAEVFGSVAAQLKAAGRQPRHRVQDLWLASQAIEHGFSLLTQNPRDFSDIPGLDVIAAPAG